MGLVWKVIRFSSFTFTRTYRSRMMSWDLFLSPYKEITAQEAFIKGTKMDNSLFVHVTHTQVSKKDAQGCDSST